MITATHKHPLNDPAEWLSAPTMDAPLSREEIAAVQKEVDSIIGRTRDNKSIALVVWNGDVRFWKAYHTDWDHFGKPKGELRRRPQVLYKTILDSHGKYVRDAFVPRFLLMTRIEPEQFAPTWERDSKIYCPVRKCRIQILPSEPPAELYKWFQTIAGHNGLCCKSAAEHDTSCFGLYAHPRACLDDLREIQKGIANGAVQQTNPFEDASAVSRRVAENMTNNYEEQSLRKFQELRVRQIEETPLAFAAPELLARHAPLSTIREAVREEAKREMEAIEKGVSRKAV